MNINTLNKIEDLNKLNLLINNTNSGLKFELYKFQETLEQELMYLLVIEQAYQEIDNEPEEEQNTIDMEKLKKNRHEDNSYTTEEQ